MKCCKRGIKGNLLNNALLSQLTECMDDGHWHNPWHALQLCRWSQTAERCRLRTLHCREIPWILTSSSNNFSSPLQYRPLPQEECRRVAMARWFRQQNLRKPCKNIFSYEFLWICWTCNYIKFKTHYCVLFSIYTCSRVGLVLGLGLIRFSVWLVSAMHTCFVYTAFVVIVKLPIANKVHKHNNCKKQIAEQWAKAATRFRPILLCCYTRKRLLKMLRLSTVRVAFFGKRYITKKMRRSNVTCRIMTHSSFLAIVWHIVRFASFSFFLLTFLLMSAFLFTTALVNKDKYKNDASLKKFLKLFAVKTSAGGKALVSSV